MNPAATYWIARVFSTAIYFLLSGNAVIERPTRRP